MQKIQHHNIDKDVIIVNKDSLILKLMECKDFYSSSNSFFGFGGIAISLISLSLFTETFRSTTYLSGETIRGMVLGLGLFCAIPTIFSALSWWRLRKTHEPKEIVKSFLKEEMRKGSRK